MYISWADTRVLASKLTVKRLINLARVTISYWISRWTGLARPRGKPLSLTIEPTTACNLACPECPSGLGSFTRPTGKLSIPLFKKIIDDLAPTTPYLILYFQGEPYLHPDFLEMVRYAVHKKMYTATSTNAHFLDDERAKKTVESGLSRLIISIDGTTQSSYAAYRKNGSLQKVLEGTKKVLYWRKKLRSATPAVIWQFLVVRPNEDEIPDLYAMARHYQVDQVVLKTAQIYDYQDGHALIPVNERYARYRQMPDGSYQIKNKLENHCWKMWSSCVMTWDGMIVPCCFDKDATHPMGTMIEKNFDEIWQSTAYQGFRKKVLNGRRHVEICKNCSEGTKIWS